MTSTQALPAGVQEWFSAPNFKTCYPYFVLWTDLVLGRAWMPAMPSMPSLPNPFGGLMDGIKKGIDQLDDIVDLKDDTQKKRRR